MWTSTGSFNQNESESTTPIVEEAIPIQLSQINAQRAQLTALEGKLLEKGLQSYNPDILMKAQTYWTQIMEREKSDMKSVYIDPRDFADSQGYKEKQYAVSFDLLRRMSRVPLIRSIIGTRQAQVSAFSRPQQDRFETGFIIQKKRDYYEAEQKELSSQDKKIIKQITDFVLKGGSASNAWHGDSFDDFLKKIVDDSLSLDQATFEVARNQAGEPTEYRAVDGATIRIASTIDDEEEESDGDAKFGYLPSHVQLIEGTVHHEYYPWELCFGTRNTTTDIYRNGYGRSELEDLVEIVTYMLNADTYNGKFFTQGSNPKGILKISGNVNTNRIQEFRQQWQSMIAGVGNAWKIPVIQSDEMDFVDMQKNNTDMQFSTWQEYLLKIACSMYKISPEELGFSVGSAGGGGSMFESGTEARLMYSRDKGLIPLLKAIEFWITKYLVEPIDEAYEFRFAGYDTDGKEKELELDLKLVNSFVGYKEMRKKWNYKEELEEGDFPLNSAWIQRTGALEMQQQQQESTEAAQQDEGEEGDDFSWDNMGDEGEESGSEDVWESLDKGHSANPMMNDLIEFWNEL
jgi:hypothetical protein